LDERFEKAQNAFRAHAEALIEQDAQAQLEQLQKKAGYCMEVEQLLEYPDPAVARSSLEMLEKRWTEVLPLKDEATELAIQMRYEKAKCALLAGGEQRDQLVSELRVNLDHRKELCLRMEILAGVESPPEVHQARLEFQVNRLAEAIGQGSEDTVGKMAEIQREWYLSGGAPANQEKILQGRFEKTRPGLKSQ
jgi:phosphoserine phosphatase